LNIPPPVETSDSQGVLLYFDLCGVRASLGETSSTSDDFFARVPPQKRKTVKDIFDLIYECSANKIVAKSLIDKIVERYLVEQNN